MKVLLTGANGYIGMRLLPTLLAEGHEVVCAVRDPKRLSITAEMAKKVQIISLDFIHPPKINPIPKDIEFAYFLIHSMKATTQEFDQLESKAAENFCALVKGSKLQQVIYLSGIVNEKILSKHLSSRKHVETLLSKGDFHLTTLRAGIIVGSGSASFEIIRDLGEKLPLMVAPKWLNTRTQPIAIRNVIEFLLGVLANSKCYDENFDIGGPDIINYKEMLKTYCKQRGLKNWIFTLPVMTPKLSSYWLYFVTSTSYPLAVNLVDSMKMEVIARDNKLEKLLGIKTMSYEMAIASAFKRIEQNTVISSWKDSMVSGRLQQELKQYIQVPRYGVVTDKQQLEVTDIDATLERLWEIGGTRGWYYANFLWRIRGALDKLIGGVGLRRGRTHPNKIFTGDVLDFWRVLLADKKEKRLLLFAEMKLPGDAWLEFRIDENQILHQTATFRPKGVIGRMYWYSLLPFHFFIFKGMINAIGR